jgi:DNA-directed RNA polymerase II subunit RPB1
MNIFIPQSIQTQIELEEIADVKRQIISPSSSRTSIGLVQDGLVGAYNLTGPTVKIDWRNAMNIMSYTSFEDMRKFEKDKKYTGQEVFTLIIPPGININGDNNFQVKDSVLMPGSRLSKDVLGEKKKFALHQLIWDEYGTEETKTFIDNAQKLVNNFNLYNGFSVGYGDACVDKSVKDNIDKYFITLNQKIDHMITELENNPDMMDKDVFEFKLQQEYGIVLDSVAKVVIASLPPTNSFYVMCDKGGSGSKGSLPNIGQIIGCLGLLAVEGKIAPKKYNNRTLAYFHQHDDRGASRGLVREPYIDGLSFPSFTFLLMAGREGIIDSALKTADSGYAQRRLVKSEEDAMIKYDCSVRTANEMLLQLVYGDSGSDITKQYEYNVDMAKMSNDELKKRFSFTSDELKEFKNFKSTDNEKIFDMIKHMRDEFRVCMKKARCDFKSVITKVAFPLNFTRIIDNTVANKSLQKGELVDPLYVYNEIERILDNKYLTLIPMTESERENTKSIKNMDEQIFKTFLKTALYNSLAPKKCCIEKKLTKLQFDTIIKTITTTYNRSVVQPGEMVGVMSAQALGEPLTQLTLNTFHAAGLKTMSSTLHGGARVKEILGVSKKIKTPQLLIQLLPEYATNKEMARKVASNLKYTTIGDIRGRINVYYEPDPDEPNSIMKEDNVKNVYYNQKSSKNSCQSDYKGLPWLMRIEIVKEKMLEKEISLIDIKSKFCNWWEKRYVDSKLLKKEEKKVINKITNIAVLSNTDNDLQPVIHIRFNVKDVDKTRDPFNREMLNEFIDQIIDKFKLKGIESISNIDDIAPEKFMVVDKETGELKQEEQYMIYTAGTNLVDIRYLVGIDIYNTISNDIVDVYKHFGIEIARTRLLRELYDAYDRAGQSVSYTNISVLIDIMTSNGILMSIDRHGMNKSDTDVLGRASFERAVDQILTAGVFGETDHMRGVSSRVMAGLVIKGGTGYCDVILDTNAIEKSEYSDETNKYRTHVEIITDAVAKDIMKNDTGDMFIPE